MITTTYAQVLQAHIPTHVNFEHQPETTQAPPDIQQAPYLNFNSDAQATAITDDQ